MEGHVYGGDIADSTIFAASNQQLLLLPITFLIFRNIHEKTFKNQICFSA